HRVDQPADAPFPALAEGSSFLGVAGRAGSEGNEPLAEKLVHQPVRRRKSLPRVVLQLARARGVGDQLLHEPPPADDEVVDLVEDVRAKAGVAERGREAHIDPQSISNSISISNSELGSLSRSSSRSSSSSSVTPGPLRLRGTPCSARPAPPPPAPAGARR